METIEIGEAKASHKGHKCSCGSADANEIPVLNARLIPKPIRHAAIFGVLESLSSGQSFIVQTGHRPMPLLHQVEKKYPGKFVVSFPVDTDEECQSMFTRND